MIARRPIQPRGPSLDGADARVLRARYHLQSLESEAKAFWKTIPLSKVYQDPEIGGTIIATISPRLLPAAISILIGEIVYNVRAALDYLVYELAILDAGERKSGTQFPIESALAGWDQHSRYLVGLSDAHKAAIQTLQPFAGCDWTATLRDVSAPDKHRELTVVQGEQVFSVKPTAEGPVVINPAKEGRRVLFAVNPRGTSPDANSDVALHIAFDDGKYVIETLQNLATNAASVLDTFKPDFEKSTPDAQSQGRR